MNWLIEHIWLVPLYPLLAALLTIAGRGFQAGSSDKGGLFGAKETSMLLTVGATAAGLVHTIAALVWLFNQGDHITPIEKNLVWLSAGHLTFSVGYLLDAMSVMMLFVVTFVSLFIQIYTHGYMEKDPGYCKFFAYLALFNFSMLGLVLSTNLFQIYIFWELVGVCSYLLIGFWFTKPSAAAAAVKAFLMNRVGDFGFLIGILFLAFTTFSWWPQYLSVHPEQAFLSFQGLPDAAALLLQSVGPVGLTLLCIFLFMGPMAKSAQVPLHTWLPDAMEGPTPISALIHAATMVAAGVFLVGRIYPLVDAAPAAGNFIAGIGTLTAVIGATIAVTQYDIKKALAYSTMSQLGFMIAAMGVGAFTAGLFHLFTHAFFKAMLFLCSGSVIHACEDEQDMRKMGGLWNKLPATAWTYLIGTIAISGLAWTSGFWSKDAILMGAQEYSPFIYYTLFATAGLTTFYMFRTFFMTFTGEYRGSAHVHHESKVMTVPLMILAIPSLLIGVALSGQVPNMPVFGDYVVYGHPHEPHSFQEAFFGPIALTSQVIGAIGLALAWAFYSSRAIFSSESVRSTLGPVYRLFANKWYFDEAYKKFVDEIYLVFARASASFDRNCIDGAVNGTASGVSATGALVKEMQSGKVQTYIAVVFFGVLTLSLLLYYWLL